METRWIEITEDEAKLLPLLYKVPLNTTLEAAAQVVRYRTLADGLVRKVQRAFAAEAKPDEAQGKKRKRQ